MTDYAGDYDTTETVNLVFNTFDSNDPATSVTITDFALGDVKIHKDGAVAQRTSSNGVTVSADFDGITGNHMVNIDLSDNSDAGFYAAGSRYQVRIEGATVDGATAGINVWVGTFSIGCVLRPTTAGRTLDVNATGEAGLDLDNTSGTLAAAQIATDAITADKIAANAITSSEIANDAITSAKIATGALTADAFAADALVAATFATDSIAADALAADAVTEIQSGLSTDAKLLAYVQLLARSDAAIETDNATELTAINANGGSGAGNFSAQTDSVEALRDHVGDGTNLTEAGGDGDHLTAINLPNQTMDIVGNITGNLSGSVGSVTGAVGSVTGAVGSVTGNVGGSVASVSGAVGSVTAEVDADVKKINGTTVIGAGVGGNLWRA